ncbi:SWI5-dependent HO expression protein 3-like isoform X2 [Prosopis cineraria]|uniref:SWI5-dependent HO expression protein 3-like isoform X2 n=1 Tax=Prosopis cineraria TaxID=364024 RepID=UPI0024104914|nr:SWI5-dependent HO expression protein 3-like isoform X2 [Prosopis cineraria]
MGIFLHRLELTNLYMLPISSSNLTIMYVKGSFDGSTSGNAKEGSSSTNFEPKSSAQSSLISSLPQAFSHKQSMVNQTEEDDETVAKALADLQACLKMPLKDIATSESNSLRFLISLNFLSRLSFEDENLSHELKATIQSLLQDFPSILYSFKSAFATINKFPKFINETQEKEAKLKEHMTMLENERQDCEAKISSLQDKKKNCGAEIIKLKNEFDSVTKAKTEMMEHQKKAQQQLFEVQNVINCSTCVFRNHVGVL